ncbi:lipocalin family protein [Chryseobacterium sp. RU33C]|uniref:lipocalin family protein n=1 Tax=Chryseobacterium sp. RU33C TaxID=1907398 RepID=UPI00147B3101|nr:lipocalin family protein [Chryseobacterium sp. RU33C]
MTATSCSSNTDDNTIIEDSVNITGNWKPYKYEFRGKTILLNECEKKGQISINTDFSGVYENYNIVDSGNCGLIESYTGKWSFENSNLTLTYSDGGNVKTFKKTVQSFDNFELRISDNSKDLDDTSGNDNAILVFVKE